MGNAPTSSTIIAFALPMCDGQTATLYVNAQGRIVGRPDNGQLYKEEINGTNGVDVIVGIHAGDEIDGKGGNDIICEEQDFFPLKSDLRE